MNASTRLENIERRIAGSECPEHQRADVVTLHPGEPEPPRKICTTCGKPILRVVVQYVKAMKPNFGGVD